MASEKQDDEIELPVELGQLASLIEKKPEALASEDKDLQDAALVAAKFIFDLTLKSESRAQPHLKELLQSIEPEVGPQTRARVRSTGGTKMKKKPVSGHSILNETPLSSLLIEGMDDEQVWAQLDLKAKNVCETLEETFDAGDVDGRGMRGVSESEDDEEDDELDSDEIGELKNMKGLKEDEWALDDAEDEDEEESEDDEDALDASDEEEEMRETVTELRDPSSEEEEDTSDEERRLDLDARPSRGRTQSRKSHGKRHAVLDDGFFSLADFNAEIEEAEAKNVSRGYLSKDADDEDSGDDNELDIFVPVVDQSPLEEGLGEDGGDTYYKDFFDAPSKADRPAKRKAPNSSSEPTRSSKVRFNEQVKVKQIKGKGKGRSLSSVDLWTGEDVREDDESDDSLGELTRLEEEEIESDGESASESTGDDIDQGREAIERLKDDLFADDDEEDPAPKSGLSTHEARMEAIRKQIAELEAENVGEKDWVLKGEVSSRARPQNGLLEEDLEFEHVSKAVPVITDEVVHDLEARIKARIIEGRFDDVVRKRPADDKPFLPSRVFELQDTKSKESLAQIYENEYMATQTKGVTDDRDAKLQKEHEEIEKQWESICYKLDALCNAHFTPKQPKATISTVSNVSAVSLESPLPTAKAASTVLAPEEVFTLSASSSRSKSELTPPEKQALRMKERKKRKKQREMLETSVDKFAKSKGLKSVKKQKEAALKSVVKTGKGVTVIGKKNQRMQKGKQQSS